MRDNLNRLLVIVLVILVMLTLLYFGPKVFPTNFRAP
jgi:hypothetical protein